MMNSRAARNSYFESQVLTASPERLQFLLLDAALSSIRKAEEYLMAQAPVLAGPELARAESILTEILGAFRKELAPELVEQSTAVYRFMLLALADAHLTDDLRRLREALRVLETEHETWRQASERSAHPHATTPGPHVSFDSTSDGRTTGYEGGFALEA